MATEFNTLCARGAAVIGEGGAKRRKTDNNVTWEFMKNIGKIDFNNIESKDYTSNLKEYSTEHVKFKVVYFPENVKLPQLSDVVVIITWENDKYESRFTTYFKHGGCVGAFCRKKLSYWKENILKQKT